MLGKINERLEDLESFDGCGCLGTMMMLAVAVIVIFGVSYAKHFFQDEKECYVVEHVSVIVEREFNIIHKTDCEYYSTSFGWKKISGFIKRKNDVYCKHCIGRLDVPIFNTWHRKNYEMHKDEIDAPIEEWDAMRVENPYVLKRVYDSDTDDFVMPNNEERERLR